MKLNVFDADTGQWVEVKPMDTPPKALDLFVIYERPIDYPDKFVVRRWRMTLDTGTAAPTLEGQLYETLDAARADMQAHGLANIGRQPGDDPSIAEVWL